MKVDYHVHSLISPDGGSDMEELCEAALQYGVREVTFTEHFEFYEDPSRNKYFDEEYLERYWNTFCLCRRKFEDRIKLNFGLEIGQPHLRPSVVARIVSEYPFDFILGSVHKIHDIDLKRFQYFDENSAEIGTKYYEEVLKMCQDGEFDCVAHLNLYARYASMAGNYRETEEHLWLEEEILRTLVERKKGIEMNGSGYKHTGESLPGIKTIKRFQKVGGQRITIGSDAHRCKEIGTGFEKSIEVLKKVGIPYFTCYEKRQAKRILI